MFTLNSDKDQAKKNRFRPVYVSLNCGYAQCNQGVIQHRTVQQTVEHKFKSIVMFKASFQIKDIFT